MGHISREPKELIPFLNRKLFEKGDCYSPGTGFCIKQDYKVYLAPADLNLDILEEGDIYTFKEMLDENGSPDVDAAPKDSKLEMSRYSKIYLYLLEEFNCECILVAQSQCTTLAGDLYSDMLMFSNKECLTNVRICATSERLNYTDKLHIPIIDFKSDQDELITDITNSIYSNMPTCACIVKGFGIIILGDNWTHVRNIFETVKDLIHNELAYQQYRVRRDISQQMSVMNNNFLELLQCSKGGDGPIIETETKPRNLISVRNDIFLDNSEIDQIEDTASERDLETPPNNDLESVSSGIEDENDQISKPSDSLIETTATTDDNPSDAQENVEENENMIINFHLGSEETMEMEDILSDSDEEIDDLPSTAPSPIPRGAAIPSLAAQPPSQGTPTPSIPKGAPIPSLTAPTMGFHSAPSPALRRGSATPLPRRGSAIPTLAVQSPSISYLLAPSPNPRGMTVPSLAAQAPSSSTSSQLAPTSIPRGEAVIPSLAAQPPSTSTGVYLATPPVSRGSNTPSLATNPTNTLEEPTTEEPTVNTRPVEPEKEKTPEAGTTDDTLVDTDCDLEDCVTGDYWNKMDNMAAKMMLSAANKFFDAFIAGQPAPKAQSRGSASQQTFSIILQKIEQLLDAADLSADEKVKGTRLARLTYGCQKCQRCLLYAEAIGSSHSHDHDDNAHDQQITTTTSSRPRHVNINSYTYKLAQQAVDTCLSGDSKPLMINSDSKKNPVILRHIEHILDANERLSLEEREVARIRLRRAYGSKSSDPARSVVPKPSPFSKTSLLRQRAETIATLALKGKKLPSFYMIPGSKKSISMIHMVEMALDFRKVGSNEKQKIMKDCWAEYGKKSKPGERKRREHSQEKRSRSKTPQEPVTVPPPPPSISSRSISSDYHEERRRRRGEDQRVERRVVEREPRDYDFREPQGTSSRHGEVIDDMHSRMRAAVTNYREQLQGSSSRGWSDYDSRYESNPGSVNQRGLNYQQATSGPIFQMDANIETSPYRPPKPRSNRNIKEYSMDELQDFDQISLLDVLKEEITKIHQTKKATGATYTNLKEVSSIIYKGVATFQHCSKTQLLDMITSVRKCRARLLTKGAPAPARSRKRARSGGAQSVSGDTDRNNAAKRKAPSYSTSNAFY